MPRVRSRLSREATPQGQWRQQRDAMLSRAESGTRPDAWWRFESSRPDLAAGSAVDIYGHLMNDYASDRLLGGIELDPERNPRLAQAMTKLRYLRDTRCLAPDEIADIHRRAAEERHPGPLGVAIPRHARGRAMSRIRSRRSKGPAGIDLSLDDELDVRLGRGTPATRLAVQVLDAHPWKLPRFYIADALAAAQQGDRDAALHLLGDARSHLGRMARRARRHQPRPGGRGRRSREDNRDRAGAQHVLWPV
ncbi:MAG: hypothetical protein ACR2GO_08980, partial [Candidatus Limnocylindria bacterium]